MKTVRLGLIGFGQQVQYDYWPHLAEREDVEIRWISGYLPEHEEVVRRFVGRQIPCWPLEGWRDHIEGDHHNVDAVVISLPNFQHCKAVDQAIRAGIHVAVDKPTAISAKDADVLAKLAGEHNLLLMTLSQRRYEQMYESAAAMIREGQLGAPFLVEYLIAHDDFGASRDLKRSTSWQLSRSKAGGGVLIGSAYHGIDAILWMLRQYNPAIRAQSVNASWIIDNIGVPGDETEGVCHVCVTLLPGPCLFSITASRWSPIDSVDEIFRIYGTGGAIRISRERANKNDRRKAPSLTYQSRDGGELVVDTTGWGAKRWAPLAEFLAAVLVGGSSPIRSPGSDSVDTIKIIERAYESAAQGGRTLPI